MLANPGIQLLHTYLQFSTSYQVGRYLEVGTFNYMLSKTANRCKHTRRGLSHWPQAVDMHFNSTRSLPGRVPSGLLLRHRIASKTPLYLLTAVGQPVCHTRMDGTANPTLRIPCHPSTTTVTHKFGLGFKHNTLFPYRTPAQYIHHQPG
jgi:hypothetical protein